MLSAMLLSGEQSEALVRAVITSCPDVDPVVVAMKMGMVTGYENAAYMVAQGLAAFPDEQLTGAAVRHLLAHVCDAADTCAMEFVPEGAVVPSREQRLAQRTWLQGAVGSDEGLEV